MNLIKKHPSPVHHLELRVRELMQLFNSLDPTPFLNKDLDREAEAFIENWAMEFPPDSRLHITIHVERLPADGDPSAIMTEAIHNYFIYKAGLVRHELRLLLRQGRASLVIGIGFVSACLIAAEAIASRDSASAIARESLTIIGWVAMWKPMQIFLYEWWPLVRRVRVYMNLRRAHVHVLERREG